ncbi:MAG: M20/M25/M40 family metallo-hydrolase [Acidobacteriota bacterium]
MKTRFAAIFYVLLLALSVTAQRTQTAPAEALDKNLRKHIEYLASDKLEGRRTGEPGASRAMEYIANQFKALKLQAAPGNRKGTYLQEFPYVTGVEASPVGNEISIEIDGKNAVAGPASIRPVGFSPNADIANTDVVFAGFGIVSPEQNRDDYTGVDAKGKIVLVLDGNPENDNPHSLLGRFDLRTKALIARDKGAVGILVVTREQSLDSDRLARLSFDQTLGEAALPTFVISRSTAAQILAITEATIEPLELGKSQHASATLAATGFKVNLKKKTSPAYNIIGVVPGTDPVLKNEAIVVGAHYDHLGRGGQGSLDVNSTEVHHGADDNASGTAAVIELARQFAAERKNKRTIIFMAFSGEEEGLLGSQYYVNHPLFPLEKTVAMINLDMIGRLNSEKLNIGGMGTAVEWPALIEEKNKVALKVSGGMGNKEQWSYTAAAPQFKLQLSDDGFGPSDHSSFYGKKIPVLFFFTGTHNDYHKPSDTAEKINYDGETRIVKYISEIVRSVDQTSARPTYTVAKSSGISGGRSGFNISLGTVPNYADSTDGLLLDGVRDNSPAAKAGILAGDKIVKLAGKDIRNVMDYTYVLGEIKAGTEYEVVVLRGGERIALKIVPVKR